MGHACSGPLGKYSLHVWLVRGLSQKYKSKQLLQAWSPYPHCDFFLTNLTPMLDKYLTQPGFFRHHCDTYFLGGKEQVFHLRVCFWATWSWVGGVLLIPPLFLSQYGKRVGWKLAQNNESQPCCGFHSQAVHSWPYKGILYTEAPT